MTRYQCKIDCRDTIEARVGGDAVTVTTIADGRANPIDLSPDDARALADDLRGATDIVTNSPNDARTRVSDLLARRRSLAQTVIEVVGADGPADLESVVGRLIDRYYDLLGTATLYLIAEQEDAAQAIALAALRREVMG